MTDGSVTDGSVTDGSVGVRRDLLFWLVAAIGVSTVVAGALQAVAPGFVLGLLDAEATATSRHFFAIVGMFMVAFGAAVTHSLVADGDHRVLLLWAAFQKLGAFVAVSIGVANDVFAGLAVLVAINDLASAGVLLWHRHRL